VTQTAGAARRSGGLPVCGERGRPVGDAARRVAWLAATERCWLLILDDLAGLLWLCSSLDGAPMCGVLDATAEMTPRLTLGYRDAVAVSPSWLADLGTRVSGHEFHRTVVHGTPAQPAWRSVGSPADGFVYGSVHASYLHLHWAGRPSTASRLVAAAL
jgi:cobyrinic acid a,c-diamide synthase